MLISGHTNDDPVVCFIGLTVHIVCDTFTIVPADEAFTDDCVDEDFIQQTLRHNRLLKLRRLQLIFLSSRRKVEFDILFNLHDLCSCLELKEPMAKRMSLIWRLVSRLSRCDVLSGPRLLFLPSISLEYKDFLAWRYNVDFGYSTKWGIWYSHS